MNATVSSADLTAQLAGREPERLTLAERAALVGRWIALPLYNSRTLPLRQIAAVGDSALDAARALRALGKDPVEFELIRIEKPLV